MEWSENSKNQFSRVAQKESREFLSHSIEKTLERAFYKTRMCSIFSKTSSSSEDSLGKMRHTASLSLARRYWRAAYDADEVRKCRLKTPRLIIPQWISRERCGVFFLRVGGALCISEF